MNHFGGCRQRYGPRAALPSPGQLRAEMGTGQERPTQEGAGETRVAWQAEESVRWPLKVGACDSDRSKAQGC